ncbi:hypothetical protein BOW31_12760, partial [Solemya velum gill symbiont]|uniref:virulence factor TspB C-terminal domain-related protein n=1 Tax=Solemya velum gill symbiont TaxID=2340 RepID=UPI0009C858E0
NVGDDARTSGASANSIGSSVANSLDGLLSDQTSALIDFLDDPAVADEIDSNPTLLPTETLPVTVSTFDPGLTQGSCPADVNVTIQGHAIMIPFTPACDALGWFKPIFLAMCTLMAAYIILGHKGT